MAAKEGFRRVEKILNIIIIIYLAGSTIVFFWVG